MVHRSSFSQHSTFEECKRWWYLLKIKKFPFETDTCYADAGNAVHHTLDKYYSNELKTVDEAKKYFNEQWKKFKLHHHATFRFKDGKYWLMVLEGIKLNISVTSTELKIYYPDALAYIDVVNSKNNIISDWKTSTRDKSHDEKYKKQGLFYSWMYLRKFGHLPEKVVFYYLKYSGNRLKFEFQPSMRDVKKIINWYKNISEQMEKIKQSGIIPGKCKGKCGFFCPYKDVCDNFDIIPENVFNVIYSGSYIRLDAKIPQLMNIVLDRTFSYKLKNSYFIKKHRPGFDGIIRFWDKDKKFLPLGFKYKLLKILNDYKEKYGNDKNKIVINQVDKRTFNQEKITMPDKFLNGIELRKYQKDAVETFLKHKLGIIQIGTGGGKTEIAIELMRKINRKTLFVIDKIELLDQTKKRIEQALGIEVGQIGDGVYDLDKFITVATMQTLTKSIRKYSDFLKSINFAIFDECHKCACSSIIKIARYLRNTEYRAGFSGTAFRDDKNDMKINSVVGYIIYECNAKELIEKDYLVKPKVIFYNNYMPSKAISELKEQEEGFVSESGEPQYHEFFRNYIIENEYRNNLIKNIVLKHKNKKILVLTKRINHGKYLAEITGGKHIYGNTPKKKRKKLFKDFKDGKFNILISTLSIFSEGINLPDLNVIINAGANAGAVKTIQVLGRVLRKSENKDDAYYIDFIDEGRFFKGASFKRRKILKKQGHTVIIKKFSE